MKHSILLSDKMHNEGIELLKKENDIIIALSKDDFEDKSYTSDAIIIVRNGKVSREIINRNHNLKVIAKHGVGLDNIDLIAAKEKNIPVVYTPDANSISVAEHFVNLCLMLSKKMREGDLSLRNGKWKKDPFDFTGIELYGKTIGILGLGRIGKHIAHICNKGFSMKVNYTDIYTQEQFEKEYSAKKMEIEELFSSSDIISVNLPLIQSTKGLINEKILKLMKPSAYIINVARGPIWCEKDVYKALVQGWISGAASDVFEKEPTEENNPLFKLKNFIGTPHMGAHTEESLKRTSLMVAEDVIAVLKGEEPMYIAN